MAPGVRPVQDGIGGSILEELFDACENGQPKCCYDSKSTYDSISEITRVCPIERFCCNLIPGEEFCPEPDYGVRGDELTNNDGNCCYDTKSVYDNIPDAKRICPAESKFCCHLIPGEEFCPERDFGVRGDDDDPTNGGGECCYESRSVYDEIPDAESVCPVERGDVNEEKKNCCCLKDGTECPVEDLGVRGDDLFEEPHCSEGLHECCYYSQTFFNNVTSVCEQVYNTVSGICRY